MLWFDDIDCTQLAYRDRRRLLEMLELTGSAWCSVPQFPFDDAEDLLESCVRFRQEGMVLTRLDARYTPGVRTDVWRKVKTTTWRIDHAPQRFPKEIREQMVMAQLDAMRRR